MYVFFSDGDKQCMLYLIDCSMYVVSMDIQRLVANFFLVGLICIPSRKKFCICRLYINFESQCILYLRDRIIEIES